jgi:hypothetical protein
MIRSAHDIHGVRVVVAAEEPALHQAALRVLPPAIADDPRAETLIIALHRAGNVPAARPELAQVWQGITPSGFAGRYFRAAGRRHLELTGAAAADIDLAGRADIHVLPRRESVLTFGIFTPTLCDLLHTRGRHAIHAACLTVGNRAVLLAGPSGAGKTTTALALAAGGLTLGGDDTCLLARGDGGVTVWALPRPCKIKGHTARLLPWISGLQGAATAHQDELAVELASIRRACGRPDPQAAAPGLVLLLGSRVAGACRLVPVSRMQAIAELSRQNVRGFDPSGSGPAGEAFAAIAALVGASRTCTLHVGDHLDAVAPAVLAAMGEA